MRTDEGADKFFRLFNFFTLLCRCVSESNYKVESNQKAIKNSTNLIGIGIKRLSRLWDKEVEGKHTGTPMILGQYFDSLHQQQCENL